MTVAAGAGVLLSSWRRHRRDPRSAVSWILPARPLQSGEQPAIVTAQHHPIYVNNVPSHWGDVSTFLKDLGNSDMIHLVDQYVGISTNNRYTLGASFMATYPIPTNHTLQVNDIFTLVNAAASVTGTGSGHVYHVFLPKGVDTCYSSTSCYSPDNPATFAICGYHASFALKATANAPASTLIFTAEPYQLVDGCSVPSTGTANSQLIDSTDTLEAITNPTGNAWFVRQLSKFV